MNTHLNTIWINSIDKTTGVKQENRAYTMQNIQPKTMQKERLSNIELLRIIAMLFVMFGHTHIRISPMMHGEDMLLAPIASFFNTMMACVSTAGVGIFIAISGWFGIRFKLSGVARYLYIVLFTLWATYGISIACGISEIDFEGIKVSLGFYHGYWFIMGYLGLYLISPILNSFIEHASKQQHQIVLLSYFLYQSYYSWISGWYDYYDGYSIIMFGGIYLTAAYIRKYPIIWLKKHSEILIVATNLLLTTIAFLSQWQLGHAARQIRDDNPLVILLSVLFILSFSKLKFQCRIINWLAGSCFAVYLIHFSPFVYPYFIRVVQYIYTNHNGLSYAVILFATFIAVYIACTIFDQIRILTWNVINRIKC